MFREKRALDHCISAVQRRLDELCHRQMDIDGRQHFIYCCIVFSFYMYVAIWICVLFLFLYEYTYTMYECTSVGKALSFVTLSMTNLIMYISLFLYAITVLLLKINHTLL